MSFHGMLLIGRSESYTQRISNSQGWLGESEWVGCLAFGVSQRIEHDDEAEYASKSAGDDDKFITHYYPGYYAADAFDPDGYSFEVVHKNWWYKSLNTVSQSAAEGTLWDQSPRKGTVQKQIGDAMRSDRNIAFPLKIRATSVEEGIRTVRNRMEKPKNHNVRYRTVRRIIMAFSDKGLSAMLSPRKMAALKDEIQALEEARENCTDSAIQKVIILWIADRRKQLACASNSPLPTTSKPRSTARHNAKPAR